MIFLTHFYYHVIQLTLTIKPDILAAESTGVLLFSESPTKQTPSIRWKAPLLWRLEEALIPCRLRPGGP